MKKYPFRFIERQGWAGVVETNRVDIIERVILPMDLIMEANGELSAAQIEAGIPFGLPFSEFLNDDIEDALHNAGIWTLDDLYRKAQNAVGALVHSDYHLSDVIKLATSFEQEDHTIVTKTGKPANKKKNKGELP